MAQQKEVISKAHRPSLPRIRARLNRAFYLPVVGPEHSSATWQTDCLPYNCGGENFPRSFFWLRFHSTGRVSARPSATGRDALPWVLLGRRWDRYPRSDGARRNIGGRSALRRSGRRKERLGLFFG